MRRILLVLVALPVAACSSSSSNAGSNPPDGPIQTAAHTSFTMPNEVGSALSIAEKGIRDAARNQLFDVRAEDALGRGRQPTATREWKVCRQSVAAGQEVDQSANVVLSVVKRTEGCPR